MIYLTKTDFKVLDIFLKENYADNKLLYKKIPDRSIVSIQKSINSLIYYGILKAEVNLIQNKYHKIILITDKGAELIKVLNYW